jgi:hypothetical protein
MNEDESESKETTEPEECVLAVDDSPMLEDVNARLTWEAGIE